MTREEEVATLRAAFTALRPTLNEALRRRWVAAAAQARGRGGQTLVAAATGVSLPTIRKGIRELESGLPPPGPRLRRPGAGRKPLLQRDETLSDELQALLPAQGRLPLRCSPLSPHRLWQSLLERGHVLSAPSLHRLLAEGGYRWHGGRVHAATAALRWRYLVARVKQFLRCGQPVLTVELSRGRAATAVPAGGPPPSPLPLRGAERTAAALILAALQTGLLQDASGAARPPVGDLLVLVGQSRRDGAAGRWQAACDRLAAALRWRVQILLLPPGIYRWEALEQSLRCEITRPPRGGPSHAVRVDVGLVPPPAPLDAASAARLYAAVYPEGLIGDGDDQISYPAFSLRSRGPRGSRR